VEKFLETAINAALKAGREILEVYATDDFQVEVKKDESPLTIADKKAHGVIKEILFSTDLPILSEEGKEIPYEERRNWELFWLVDPLDGTKEFIKRNGEFTVNIALIQEGIPILGVVYAPVLKEVYYALKGKGAFKAIVREGILFQEEVLCPEMSAKEGDSIVVVASRSHMSSETEEFIRKAVGNRPVEVVSRGSSLKLCLVAEGKADFYPRLAPTMEWDTAAGQAVVEISGGRVFDLSGNPLRYNKPDLLNPYFVAVRKGYEL